MLCNLVIYYLLFILIIAGIVKVIKYHLQDIEDMNKDNIL